METETLKHRDVEGPRHIEVRTAGVQPGGYEILVHYSGDGVPQDVPGKVSRDLEYELTVH